MLTYLLWSCSGMLFKLPDQDVTSTCCRGWHLWWHFFLPKKFSPSLDDFLSWHLPGTCFTSTRQNVIEMTWMSPSANVVYSSCVCGKHIETVAWSYSQHCSLLHSPLDFILICGCTAWRIIANGNLFWWLQKSSSNITNQGWKFSLHPSVLYHGFIPLLLELKHAEQHVGGRGGPGRVRGGISCSPSPTIPTMQHLKWEKCCGGADQNLACQS